MLQHHHRLVGLLIAGILMLAAPAAMAGKSSAKNDHSTADDKCRGNSHGHSNSEKARSCEEHEEAESPPASEEPKEDPGDEDTGNDPGRGKDRGHGNGRGKSHAPGQERKEDKAQGSPDAEPTPPAKPGDKKPPPEEEKGPARLMVDVDVDRNVAQVGTLLTYQISITNQGATKSSLTIDNDVPAEVDFISSTKAVTMSDADSLAWSIADLEPGTVTTMEWTGRVARLGDLDAANVVTVDGAGADPAPIETHTYLASVQGVSFQRSAAEPDWGTHTERRVVFRSVGAHAPATAASSDTAPAQLPRTGVPLLELSLIAALLVLGGLVLTGRGKRHAAAAMMVVLVAAACTSETTPPPASQSAETPEDEDRVLGTRIEGNDSKEDDSKQEDDDEEIAASPTPAIPGTDNGSDSTDTPLDTDAEVQPPAPVDTEETVREVVVVTVGNEPPAPEPLAATDGSNTMSVVWDEPSRSITSATSGRMITRESRVDLLATVSDAGDGMSAGVTLTNVTRDARFLVSGHLVLDVMDGGGTVVRLSSPPINQILEPGDEVSADFLLALPSGSYAIESAFVPS